MRPTIMRHNIRSRSGEVIRQLPTAPATMYWAIILVLCVFAEAAKLDRAYLPPPNAKEAGGHEDDLQLPLEPPYIDPYSDNGHLVPHDGRRVYGGRGYKPRKESPRSWDDTEDEPNIPDGSGKPESRFLYGSYSYTGPDNVLVTVTYTANKKKPKGMRRYYEDDYDDYPRRRFDWYDPNGDHFDGVGFLEGGVVPTPPSLPRELQKAFAFHRKKYQSGDKKDGGRAGKILPAATGQSRQPWSEQPTEKPIIHQGYSYPKATTAKN